MKKFVAFSAALVMSLSISTVAQAQPVHLQPASTLIFPLFDSQAASATVLNVTNTNTSNTVCTNFFREGDVRLHYVYFSDQCQESDLFEDLTPGDTLTVLASDHNPQAEQGFLIVTALDPETSALLDFDFLVGSAYVANSNIDIMWSYTPYGFQGVATNSTQLNACNLPYIVDDTVRGPLQFDGVDYAMFPDTLYIDSFFEEDAGSFDNFLTLMSCSGGFAQNQVDFIFYNNQEDPFSRTFNFTCWTSVALSDISGIASSLGGDPNEFVKETGWARITGRDVLDLAGNSIGEVPSLLGVVVQIVGGTFNAGHALHYSGSQAACTLTSAF